MMALPATVLEAEAVVSTAPSMSSISRSRTSTTPALRPTGADQRHLRALPQDRAQPVLSPSVRQKVYRSIDDLQADLDLWVREYNEARSHRLSDRVVANTPK
jgi:hypothetical protein